MPTIKPIGNRVLVKLISEEEGITKSGIVLTEVKQTKNSRGTVLAVADGVDLAPGLVVWFAKYAGEELEDNMKILALNELIAYESQEEEIKKSS